MEKKSEINKFKAVFSGSLIILVIVSSLYVIEKFSCSKELHFYSISVPEDTTLTIGIIGDSWVAGKKLDSILHYELLGRGYGNKVLSSGQAGAKSKLVYQNLFEEENGNSSKYIIENRPDYCILIAGVNDATVHVGRRYYSHHIILIIKTLLHYNIKPVVVSCPEFGIKETIENMKFLKRNRIIITSYFNNKGEIDNIKAYRNSLNELLESEYLRDSIMLIDFDNVCIDYINCQELYANPSHLNSKGVEKLVRLVVDELVKELSSGG